MELKDKAIEYIEKLCMVYENSEKKDIENTQKIIDSIYKYAHCVNKSASCYHIHDDWREQLKQENWEI